MQKNNYRTTEKMMSNKEFKNYIFSIGKVASVKDPVLLEDALESGEYIIGVRYNPFTVKVVYHYENDTFQVFHFVPGCVAEPLNIELEYEGDNMPIDEAMELIYYFGMHEDLLINPTKDMLNLDNINN